MQGGGGYPAVWGIFLWEARVCSFYWGEPARLTHQKTLRQDALLILDAWGGGDPAVQGGGGSRGVGWDPPVGGGPQCCIALGSTIK